MQSYCFVFFILLLTTLHASHWRSIETQLASSDSIATFGCTDPILFDTLGLLGVNVSVVDCRNRSSGDNSVRHVLVCHPEEMANLDHAVLDLHRHNAAIVCADDVESGQMWIRFLARSASIVLQENGTIYVSLPYHAFSLASLTLLRQSGYKPVSFTVSHQTPDTEWVTTVADLLATWTAMVVFRPQSQSNAQLNFQHFFSLLAQDDGSMGDAVHCTPARATEVQAQHDAAEEIARALSLDARIDILNNAWAGAARCLHLAAKWSPLSAFVHKNNALLLLHSHRFEEALYEAEAAIMLDGSDAEHWSLFVIAMSESRADASCDIASIVRQSGSETASTIAKSVFDFSVWLLRAGDLTLAFNCSDLALRIEPGLLGPKIVRRHIQVVRDGLLYQPRVEVSHDEAQGQAYATLVANDDYVIPALVLAQSLRNTNTTRPLVAICVNVTAKMEQLLVQSGWIIAKADAFLPHFGHTERWKLTFNKIYLWQLTAFSKIVYVDSDIILVSNIDELFLYPAFGAVEWAPLKSTFNSGVMVIEPSIAEYNRLAKAFAETPSDTVYFSDQEFLNMMFPDWFALPYQYNFRLRDGLKTLEDDMRISLWHFAGIDKPWDRNRNTELTYFFLLWWLHYDQVVATIGPLQ